MEIRAARRSERDEVLDLLSLWYDDRAFFARYNQNDPKFRDDLCLIARDRGGALISTVQIFDRTINLDGKVVPMGGIGSVFTRKDYRHKGVASSLMRLAIDTLEREGFEVSLLFAERLTFYNQFGWREINRKFSMISDALQLGADAATEIDVLDLERDLAEIMSIHRAYSGRINVTAVRDESEWRGSLRFAGNQPMNPGEGSDEYFVLTRKAGAIAAYARAIRLYGITMVMEYGYREGAFGSLAALLRHLGEIAIGRRSSFRLIGDHRRASRLHDGSGPTTPTSAIATHLAHDPDLELQLAAAGASLVHHTDNNYMWRIIAPEKLGCRFSLEPEDASTRAFELFASEKSLYWTADRF